MLNAYQLGFLAAQPQVFTKAASLTEIRRSVLVKYAAVYDDGAEVKGRVRRPTNAEQASMSRAFAADQSSRAMSPESQSIEKALYNQDMAKLEAARPYEEMLSHKSHGLPDRPSSLESLKNPSLVETVTDPERISPLTDRPPAPESFGTRAGKAIDEGTSKVTETAKGLWDKTKDLASTAGGKVRDFSSGANVALGGAKDKHTRTLIALATLLAGAGGAYALGRSGGDGSRERA